MSKPAIVIVSGSFTGPEFYTPFSSILQTQHGHEVIVGSLQSAITSRASDPNGKAATLQEDASYFRGIVEALASQGKDVVVVGHSFGGTVATQSVKNVIKSEREAAGGGVVRVVYLATPLPDVGQTGIEGMGGQLGPFIKILGDYMHIDSDASAPAFFPGIPSAEALELARKLKIQSTASFLDPLNYSAVDHVPVTYIHTAQDPVVPLEYQQAIVEKLKARNAHKVSTMTIDENHFLMTTAVAVTAQAIVDAIN